jgi:hypothetical protein
MCFLPGDHEETGRKKALQGTTKEPSQSQVMVERAGFNRVEHVWQERQRNAEHAGGNTNDN